MLRNSKPKIIKLTNYLAEELNNMNFYSDTLFSGRKEIDEDTTIFQKNYSCCGGSFELFIRLGTKYIFCGEERIPEVKIITPYNSWWNKAWNIKDFTKDMEKFQKELEEDLKKLRKLGIIS